MDYLERGSLAWSHAPREGRGREGEAPKGRQRSWGETQLRRGTSLEVQLADLDSRLGRLTREADLGRRAWALDSDD